MVSDLQRTPEQLREHYEIEKALAARLRAGTSEERRRLNGELHPEPKRCSIDGCDRLSNYGPLGYCRMHEYRHEQGLSLDARLLRAANGQRIPCIIEGCHRGRQSNLGYCQGHARRVKTSGSLDASFEPRMEQPETCVFTGCAGQAVSKGYCAAHLRQMRVHGRMIPVRTVFDECSYGAAHRRCTALWRRVRQYPCAWCGESAHEWAYDGTDPSELYDEERDWALRTILPYSRFPEFYMPMCKSCHKKRDVEELRAELIP